MPSGPPSPMFGAAGHQRPEAGASSRHRRCCRKCRRGRAGRGRGRTRARRRRGRRSRAASCSRRPRSRSRWCGIVELARHTPLLDSTPPAPCRARAARPARNGVPPVAPDGVGALVRVASRPRRPRRARSGSGRCSRRARRSTPSPSCVVAVLNVEGRQVVVDLRERRRRSRKWGAACCPPTAGEQRDAEKNSRDNGERHCIRRTYVIKQGAQEAVR